MKTIPLLLFLAGCVSGVASADPNNLVAGVLIAHYDPDIVWSDPREACQAYQDARGITACEQQNPQIMESGTDCVWYVLAHWWEEKTFCLCEFGFGPYDEDIFVFDSFGPCAPGRFLEIPTSGWPGPVEGTAVTAIDVPWTGNFVPVYYFAGTTYATAGQIPFAADPATDFAGFVNCSIPPEASRAVCLPAMGINMSGSSCCGAEWVWIASWSMKRNALRWADNSCPRVTAILILARPTRRRAV